MSTYPGRADVSVQCQNGRHAHCPDMTRPQGTPPVCKCPMHNEPHIALCWGDLLRIQLRPASTTTRQPNRHAMPSDLVSSACQRGDHAYCPDTGRPQFVNPTCRCPRHATGAGEPRPPCSGTAPAQATAVPAPAARLVHLRVGDSAEYEVGPIDDPAMLPALLRAVADALEQR